MMRQTWIVIVILATLSALFVARANEKILNEPLPEFTHQDAKDWINSAPLSVSALRGNVVLIDFWTYGCWNCYRSFPWLTDLEARYKDKGLKVIGVHTPEFDHEKIRANIEQKMQEFNLHHPVMIDNDFSYWNEMRNAFWPSFYLVDKQGQVRFGYYGETHVGEARAITIETAIKQLLAE